MAPTPLPDAYLASSLPVLHGTVQTGWLGLHTGPAEQQGQVGSCYPAGLQLLYKRRARWAPSAPRTLVLKEHGHTRVSTLVPAWPADHLQAGASQSREAVRKELLPLSESFPSWLAQPFLTLREGSYFNSPRFTDRRQRPEE